MTAPFDTTKHERVGRGAKASRAIALSCAHQREASNSAPLSRGHHVHVVSNQPKKGFSTEPCPAVLTPILPVELARALSRVLFQPNSHWSRYPSSLAVTNRGVSSFSRALPRVHSANGQRPTASVRNRLPHQRLVNRTADRLHHLSDLSSSPSFDGFQTIGKAFDEWTKTNFGIGQK